MKELLVVIFHGAIKPGTDGSEQAETANDEDGNSGHGTLLGGYRVMGLVP